jgi:hypothetical protein
MNTWLKNIVFILSALIFVTQNQVLANSSKDCMEGICIGDRLDSLDAKWETIEPPHALIQKYNSLPKETPIASIYDEYNEIFSASDQLKLELAPYIIDLQRFDDQVLNKLNTIPYFCTATTLAGLLKTESSFSKIWVTARVVPDDARKGHFRVVQLERVYSYMAPFLRPRDEPELDRLKKDLKKEYPNIQVLRNIDNLRGGSNDITLAKYLFGFKFISASNVPATFRIKDSEDIEPIDYSELKNEKCPNDW